jgi:hypothetical protein
MILTLSIVVRMTIYCRRDLPITLECDMRKALLAAVLLGSATLACASATRAQDAPRFEQFPAAESFSGRPAAANFSTAPDVARFAGHFQGALRRGPNFAGAYTIVTWPCGTLCQNVAVVSARDGSIVMAPEAYNGVAYRRDSRLLVINPPERRPAGAREDELPAEMRPEFLVFENGLFRRIDRDAGGWNPNVPNPRLPNAPLQAPRLDQPAPSGGAATDNDAPAPTGQGGAIQVEPLGAPPPPRRGRN